MIMANTKQVKIEFGYKAQLHYVKNVRQDTQGNSLDRVEMVKIVHKDSDGRTFSGYRKVNYTDKKKKEVYQKINRMLGGN